MKIGEVVDKKLKILIIQPKKLGDVVLTTPIIEALYKHFNEQNILAKIDFLVEDPFQEILINNPFLDKIHILNKKEGFFGKLKILSNVRKEKYDYIFDFFGNPTTCYITFFSKAKETYSFDYRIYIFAGITAMLGYLQFYHHFSAEKIYSSAEISLSQLLLKKEFVLSYLAVCLIVIGFQYLCVFCFWMKNLLQPLIKRIWKDKKFFLVLFDN